MFLILSNLFLKNGLDGLKLVSAFTTDLGTVALHILNFWLIFLPVASVTRLLEPFWYSFHTSNLWKVSLGLNTLLSLASLSQVSDLYSIVLNILSTFGLVLAITVV